MRSEDENGNKSKVTNNIVLLFLLNIPKNIAIFLITFYRFFISPLFPGCCRFEPTCSAYGLESFRKYGFVKGFKLTFKRLIKCHPGGPHGYDPVP